MSRKATALTIAGSDSGGGAGIQADLKTFAAFEVYGTSAITAVTAQNTTGVSGIEVLSADMVAGQIDAVLEDIGADAIKTGMLANRVIVETVADRLRAHAAEKVVVDPVMVAKGGDRLLQEDAVDAVRRLIAPLALVITPNAGEAEVLTGREVRNLEQAREAARAIFDLGPRHVVVKGGHFGDDAVDVLFDGTAFTELPARRIDTRNTHGTGCTFASAVAAGLARGNDVETAVSEAKAYVTASIAAAFPVGAGHGPLNHFHRWWND